MRLIFVVVFAVLTLSGCGAVDTMTEGIAHAQEVSTDLEKAIGSKPVVGFNWSNGSLNQVTVTFESIPAGISTNEIAQHSKRAIAERFKQQPGHIIISFVVSSDP